MNSKRYDVMDTEDLYTAESRALLMGCGYSGEELKKPRIAVFNTLNPMNPGHLHQREIADRVAEGVRAAGGLPVEFNGTNICDSMLDNQEYTLPSRDLLVNDIDLMIGYHRMDAMVLIGTCDKVLPALLMAAARINIPAIIVTGGFMKGGCYRGREVNFVDIGVARGQLIDGKISREEFDGICNAAVPGGGACGMMGTGNTMSCICEAMGMTLPGNSTTAGRSNEMLDLAYRSGLQIMELLRKEIRPDRIITEKSISNAIKTCMAIGGSGNTIIHVPAVAAEAGIRMDLSEIYADASFEIPLLVAVRPNGRGIHTMTDFAAAGGLGAIMKEISGSLYLDCLTVNEATIGENIRDCGIKDNSVIHPLSDPISSEGGLALLKGNLVPEGTYVKQSAVPDRLMKMRGEAICFGNAADAISALQQGRIHAGHIVIIRYMGPKASYGSAYYFAATLKGTDLYDKVAVITDGCLSGAAAGASFQFAAPEAALGSPLGIVRDGDVIEYSIPDRTMNLELSDEEISRRLENFVPEYKRFNGFLGIYQRGCTSISEGAILK